MTYRNKLAGNAGLYYASWQLSRRGWHVMPTVGNARGSDQVFRGTQSNALSKRDPVPVGKILDVLRLEWWVIIILVNTPRPRSYVLTFQEIKRLSHGEDVKG